MPFLRQAHITPILNLDYDSRGVANLERLQENQIRKMSALRERVRKLEFVPIEPAGSYIPMTFKSFDGGRFNLRLEPFEFEVVKVADSNGNVRMNFAAPVGDLEDEDTGEILADLDADPIMRGFLDMLGARSLRDTSRFLTAKGTLMEIAEFACIFDAVERAPKDSKSIILKDGLLRTRKIRDELIPRMIDCLRRNRGHVRVVGVAKTSKIAFLLHAALACERIFPPDQAGYIRIPLDVENMAYKWSPTARLRPGVPTRLAYALGDLYIAKLSRSKNLFVTVELPQGTDGRCVYSESEVTEIMSYLAKDAMYAYPVMGYPQTIMRAHESAAGLGISASMLYDNIIKGLVERSDPLLAEYIRDSAILDEAVSKGSLGGGA